MRRTALAGLFCVPAIASAQPAAPCRIPDFPAPTLCARAGLDTLRASYLVLLDESGSMRPLWGTVRSALLTFLRAIPDGDDVDLRLFAGNSRRINVPVPFTSPVRDGLTRQVEQLGMPSGAHTDLGLAVEQALRVVAAAPVARQQFIYVITDGAHDPAPGSGFALDGSGRWDELAQTARALATARPISFAVLRLTAQADAQGFVSKSLPNADVVSVLSSAQLQAWFTREARSVALKKLQLRIADERRRPAFVDSALSAIVAGASVTSTRQALRPTVISRIESASTSVMSDGISVTVAATRSASDSTVLLETKSAPRAWYLPPSGTTRNINQTFPVQVTLEPRDELERIGVLPGPMVDSVRVVAFVNGLNIASVATYWGAVLLLLAGTAFGVRQAKWASHTPRFMGQIRMTRCGGDQELANLAALTDARFDWKSVSGELLAVLEARKERGRTALWAIPRSPGLTMNGRPLTKATRFRGTTRLECAGEELNYFPTSTSEYAAQ